MKNKINENIKKKETFISMHNDELITISAFAYFGILISSAVFSLTGNDLAFKIFIASMSLFGLFWIYVIINSLIPIFKGIIYTVASVKASNGKYFLPINAEECKALNINDIEQYLEETNNLLKYKVGKEIRFIKLNSFIENKISKQIKELFTLDNDSLIVYDKSSGYSIKN